MHPTGDNPVVSVVIPARNEASTISRAIEPLLTNPPVSVEVIVADGRSTDSTRDVIERLAERDGRIRLVDNPARITPEGLNAAIRTSRGEIIVRMDGHAEPGPGYLAACLDVLRSSGAWNVGGRIVKSGSSAAGRAASAAATSPFGVGGGSRHHLALEARDLDTVAFGCWPRWVFEQIGLYDPEMVQDQDEELNQRILDAGGTIRFDPSIWASYLSRASWRGLARQHFRYGFYKIRAIQKRPRLLRMRHLVPAGFVGLVIATLALTPVDARIGLVGLAALLAWSVSAVWFARRVASAHDATVPQVVAAYACMHGGYGVGVWVGSIRFLHRWFIDRHGHVPRLPAMADSP